MILLNTEREDTESANSLARNEETYFGMILYDFSCRGHQSITILFLKTETVGSIYLYVREKKPNKFSLHSIEKPNDIQGSFRADSLNKIIFKLNMN